MAPPYVVSWNQWGSIPPSDTRRQQMQIFKAALECHIVAGFCAASISTTSNDTAKGNSLMIPLYLALLPAFASAYTFNFTSIPQQCENLDISIAGSGKPPYSVTIIPFGPSPLENNTEVRRIFQTSFSGSSTSFNLPYPADSQFVAVVSDSSGFGSGGTSIAATVLSSSAPVCYNTTEVSPAWAFSIVPANQLVECSPTRIWWNPSVVQGTPTFQGVIPGGQSFSIPESNFSTVPEEGYGFDWTPSVRIGTTVILVGSDNSGAGTGGSGLYIVSQGSSQSCLDASSPSSTPGSPAGGTYPTSTSGAGVGDGNSGSSGSHTNVGAIVGGVIGGVGGAIVLAVLLLLFLRHRKRASQTPKERPVDLLNDTSDHDHDDGGLPQYYEPEPYVMPEPTVLSTAEGSSQAGSERRQTLLSMPSGLRPGTPDSLGMRSGTTGSRKSPAPPTLRAVNIVQHEDAGPPEPADQEEEPETIELPPAYTNLRKQPPTQAGTVVRAIDQNHSLVMDNSPRISWHFSFTCIALGTVPPYYALAGPRLLGASTQDG
ncbi:predicted protein [Postia placenta Mad-698-R]|nr:predicted protein [Postia placenta Mad-698-R]